MMKCDKLAFQGDISLLAIGKLPEGVIQVTKELNGAERESYGYHQEKGLVLAQGESRAHYHAFRDTENVKMFELSVNDNNSKRLFLVIEKPIALFHEEHDPIEFEADVYELFFQSEYTFEEEYRRVAD